MDRILNKKVGTTLFVVTISLLMVLGIVSPAFADPDTYTPAFHDSYVSSANPNTNYGSAVSLYVEDNGHRRWTYLKFDISPWPCGTIIWVWLVGHVKGNSEDPPGLRVYAHACRDDSWDENTITWNNRPTKEESLTYCTVGPECSFPVWQSEELTDYVRAECYEDHIVTIVLACDGYTGWREFHSKEFGSFELNWGTHRVGGVLAPINKLGLLAPYIGLTSTIVVATAATAIYARRVKRRKQK